MGEKLTRSETAARLRAEAADEDMRIAEDRVAHAARYVDPRDAEIARLRAAVLARSEDLSAAMARTNGLEEANRTLRAELDAAKAEVERERMRLVACGVIALSDTPESLDERLSNLSADYRSASLDDVTRTVRALIAARAALAKEREAIASMCDEQAALAKRDRCHAEAGTLRQIASSVRARLAAEAIPHPFTVESSPSAPADTITAVRYGAPIGKIVNLRAAEAKEPPR